jgi:hypothetical protein
MEADDLLQQLGEHARDDAEGRGPADDAVWDKLAGGELTPAEDAELRRRAADDPAVKTLYEAYRPLDEATKARLAARATRDLAPRKVIAFRRALLLAGPIAAAAGLILFLSFRSSSTAGPTLPAYSLSLSGGDRATRSGEPVEQGPVELHPGSRLEVVLRPATAVAGGVVVQSFVAEDGDARLLNVPIERSAEGAVRIAGEAQALLGAAPGSRTLAFVVCPEGAPLPTWADVARAAGGEARSGPCRVLSTHVRLVGPP